MTLGRQDILFAVDKALAVAANYGLVKTAKNAQFEFPDNHPFLKSLARKELIASSGSITDVALFSLLGFQDTHSLDVSAFEGATLLADLNDGGSAARLEREFHFVFDGGTMEHVFHVPNVLKNIYDLLCVGGIVLHWSPANNHVDHGFYQFSPTLFYDYYSANSFDILDCQFMKVGEQLNGEYQFHAYTPGSLDGVSFGGLDNRRYEVAFLARKTAKSTWDVVPQQFAYRRQSTWAGRRDS